MANKAISCGAYIQFILDDEEHFVFKQGVTIENPYGGSINNIAIYIDGETTTPHWYGEYTTFDEPSAGSGAALKTAINSILTIDVGIHDGNKGDITVSNNGKTWLINSQPKFSSYLNANQTITTGVITKVTLDVENFDVGGYFDSTTNYRFTPLVAGKYLVSGMINFLNAAGIYTTSLYLYKNGALIRINERAVTNVVGNNSQSIIDIVEMNGTTDYLELFVLHNSGANKTLLAGPSRTYFSGSLLF